MNRQENFLPYEHSKMLKELGFDEKCFAFHSNTNLIIQECHSADIKPHWDRTFLAPLWQQVEEWLWNTHKISIECECVSVHDIMFKVRVYKFMRGEAGLIQYLHFDSPIIGKMEGIKKAIEYLHELSGKDHCKR